MSDSHCGISSGLERQPGATELPGFHLSPVLLMGLGVLFVVLGVAYGVVTVGVPYTPDARPELLAAERFHMFAADGILMLGMVVFGAGLILMVMCIIVRSLRALVGLFRHEQR
jgi:hypothetical protein